MNKWIKMICTLAVAAGIPTAAMADEGMWMIHSLDEALGKKMAERTRSIFTLDMIIMLILSVWTNCLRVVSDLIGIVYPSATLFLFLLCGIILILFQYSLLLSRNQERISRLAQELAILKAEIEEMRKKR